ncbi:MAG: putative sulfatase [Halioglobus sp.]
MNQPVFRGIFLAFFVAVLLASKVSAATSVEDTAPNIIVILTDDMGYGDLGAYGNRLIRTPHIDAIAHRGVIFSNGYASANVCSPSRAGLLTGRYAIRSGLAWKVVESGDSRSLPRSEETIAELVKRAGYRTGMVGKWHLGAFPENLPLEHGFDYFFGVAHSNDMPNFFLYDGTHKIQGPVDQRQLTRQYTQAARKFIEQSAEQPFLLFVSHTFPHIPLYSSEPFAGRSAAGAYGDTVEEIDWSTGELVASLKSLGLLDNTLIVFTSDNGPFFEGSTAGLKGGKGNSWEGGYRVPFIVSWPKSIQPGKTSDKLAANIDILPTIAEVLELSPSATQIDGVSLLPTLQDGEVPHRYLYFFNNEAVVGMRDQQWKYLTHSYYTGSIGAFEKFDQLPGFKAPYDLLFDAQGVDGESYSVSDRHPQVMSRMKQDLRSARKKFDSLRTRPAENTYP